MRDPIVAQAGGVDGDSSPQEQARRVAFELEKLHRRMSDSDFQEALRSIERDGTGRPTQDSFQNFILNLGQGTDNAVFSGSTYGFNPITRVRTLLEWIHRGSWLGGVAIDLVADDMTRAGCDITSPIKTKDEEKINNSFTDLEIWNAFNDGIKWSRLYGGALLVILIDGQDLSDPLRLEGVPRGGFRGLAVFDRWMLEPDFSRVGTVSDLGPRLGEPKFYKITGYAHALSGQKVHYSRCIRLEGIRLPYWQRVMEMGWGISVLERLYDRMIAFDAATTGAAQLVHKSYLRVFKVDGLRQLCAAEGEMLQQFAKYVDLMRRYQGQEGMTLIDGADEFLAETKTGFNGIPEALMQFGQQIAGALQVPLVRLFGMSPAGFSATGESDLRTYYDGINQRQNKDLKTGVGKVFRVVARSESVDLGSGFAFGFRPLWQLTEEAKAAVGNSITSTINQSQELGIVSTQQALREYRASARLTGIWASITEEDVERADPELHSAMEGGEGGEGEPDEAGGQPKFPTLPHPPGAAGLGAGRPRLRLLDEGKRVDFDGLPIYIETPKGELRRGRGWATKVAADYGFITLSGSPEGAAEGLDCFIGDDAHSSSVWVIEQINPKTEEFDEYKVMLGFPARADALSAYRNSYSDDATDRIGAVRKLSLADFKKWLEDGGWRGDQSIAA